MNEWTAFLAAREGLRTSPRWTDKGVLTFSLLHFGAGPALHANLCVRTNVINCKGHVG